MKSILNDKLSVEERQEIIKALKENEGYCPCMTVKTPDTKCQCKDFVENVKPGEVCHCGLYKKLEN